MAQKRRISPTPKQLNEVQCPDCGDTYTAGAPHGMFCIARTCNVCGTTYGFVIRETGNTIDVGGEPTPERICQSCIEDEEEDE